MQAEYFALEGISELLDTIERIRGALNPILAIEGVLLTMFDDRTNLAQQVTAELIASLTKSSSRPRSRATSGWQKLRATASRYALRSQVARRRELHSAGEGNHSRACAGICRVSRGEEDIPRRGFFCRREAGGEWTEVAALA